MYKSIVVCGKIASGTTTTAKNLAKKLNLKFESTGSFFRKYAISKNIPLYDKTQVPDEVDRKIDEKMTNLAKNGGYAIDAHYLGYFCRNSRQVLKVLLVCNQKERFKRGLARKHTHVESIEEMRKREQGLVDKFHKLYSNEDYEKPRFFDIVVDTKKLNKKEAAEKIIKKFNSQPLLK